MRMSDDCGVLQHSRFGAPDRHHGYCTDDNARALALMARIATDGAARYRRAIKLATSCAAFVSHAWNSETGRFRNFMGFDRRWLDEGGSDDCCARALEALCLVARDWPHDELRTGPPILRAKWSRHASEWSSLRAQALTIRAMLTAEGGVIGAEEARKHIEAAASSCCRRP